MNLVLSVLSVVVLVGFGQLMRSPAEVKQPTIEVTPTPFVRPATPTPTPAGAKKQAQKPNQITCTGPDGKQFQTTQKECDEFNSAWGNTAQKSGACKDPDGNVIADEKCPWLAEGYRPPQPAQPTTDYYVPTYEPLNSGYTYGNYRIPEPPEFETYTPNFPTADFPEPEPITWQEIPPYKGNCQTYTTNGGSIEICK